ncbi:MAG TPA: hypothetical protein VMI75_06710 [Polyangiaceae bacterium]|nr:hypothetical protein [Polyangiaceae bacterium]
MTELNPTKSRALGHCALGIFATTLAMGCGSGDGSAGPIGGEPTGASKATITARGFTANGCVTRGVFDITAPTAIDFVAMAPTDLRSVQMQLYTVDGQGLDTPVRKTAQAPSAQLVSLLDDPATDQVKNLIVANVGNVGGAHATSSMVGAYQNGSSANQTSAGASHYTTNEGTQSGQSVGHQYSWNGNGAAAAADGAQSNAAQTQQSAAAQSSATTLAFTDLSLLNASHFMLVINMTASGANGALRLFQGSNGVVTDAQNFPIVTPACGTGA